METETLFVFVTRASIVLAVITVVVAFWTLIGDHWARKVAINELAQLLKEDSQLRLQIPSLGKIPIPDKLPLLERTLLEAVLWEYRTNLPPKACVHTERMLESDSKKQTAAFVEEILTKIRKDNAWQVLDERMLEN